MDYLKSKSRLPIPELPDSHCIANIYITKAISVYKFTNNIQRYSLNMRCNQCIYKSVKITLNFLK